MQHYGVTKKAGVVGLEGLGHMAVKFARALGATLWSLPLHPTRKKMHFAWAQTR
jgi:D-arabinose 1-dehydrogenase-like Zn-dependent alcohol dehydrogenase